MAARLPPNIWRNDIGSDPWNEKSKKSETDLAGVVVDDEALVPAVEVFVRVDLDAELLQHRLVGPLAHRVHGGAHVIQDAHDARRILQDISHSLKSASFCLIEFCCQTLPIREICQLISEKGSGTNGRGVGTHVLCCCSGGEACFKPL